MHQQLFSMKTGCKRRRCTMRTGGGDLPADVLDVILARLPLRDAARASVLSAAWGRAWRQLSDLDFTTTPRPGAVDAVLRHHSGPVRRARFRVTDAHLPGVRGWTARLSQSQLQSLDLAFRSGGARPPVPDLAPACARALRKLVLTQCVLPPVAPSTTGTGSSFSFPSLTTLRLKMVSVQQGSDLEAMVSTSTCPKLEELTMLCVAVLGDDDARRRHQLRMASPSLRFLEMGHQQNIDWVAACLPRLEVARLIDGEPDSVANLLKGMASSVNKLVYRNCYLETELPKGLPSSYANLNRLRIRVDFNYAPEITSMIYFMKSAPNLTQLVVDDFTDESVEECPYHYWPPLISFEICPNLKFLHIVATSPLPLRNTLNFMRLVLSAARMLQILEVGTGKNNGNQQVAEEISRYARASPGVQIRFKQSFM